MTDGFREYMVQMTYKKRQEGGRREREPHDKRPDTTLPLVSVITVVRNGREFIEGTIQSVLSQTYPNIEYIIIDGASTDGTVDILRKYNYRIDYWLSEPDKGLYDAMNKGVLAASGEWINFMNAGDRFYRTDSVETIFLQTYDDAGLLYGHHQIIYNDRFSVVRKARDVKDLWKGVICCHQTMFVRRDILKEHPFDLSYRIAADSELVYSAFKRNYKFYRSDTIVASIAASGFSHSHLLEGYKEYKDIVKKYNDSIIIDIYYAWVMVFSASKIFLKKILPSRLSELIISLKNR